MSLELIFEQYEVQVLVLVRLPLPQVVLQDDQALQAENSGGPKIVLKFSGGEVE